MYINTIANRFIKLSFFGLLPMAIFGADPECSPELQAITQPQRKAKPVATAEADPDTVAKLNALMNPSAANMNLVSVKTTAATRTNEVGETVVVVSPAQIAEHNPYARQLAQFIGAADLTDGAVKKEIRDGMKGLQARVLTVDANFASTALKGTMSQLSRTDIGAGVADDLLDLSETMSDIDPERLFQAAPSTAIGRFFVGIRDLIPGEKVVRKRILRFFTRFREVEATIDGSTGKLLRSFDAEEKEIEEAYKPDADMLRETSLEQIKNYALLEALHTEVLAVYNAIPDKNSEKAVFIKSEVLTAIADFSKTVAEMIGILQQAEMGQLLLIETGESTVRRGREEVAKAKIGIASGVVIAAAMGKQQNLIRGITAIRKKAIEIQTRNANNLLAHVLEVNGFEIDASQTEALQRNYETYKKIHDERKKAQAQRYQIVTAALPKLKETRAKMEALISDQRKGMIVRGQLKAL